jgi:hypothetical protein
MIALYEQVKDLAIHERDFKGNYAVQYIEKKRGISKTGTKVTKKPKKCGYCRATGHNRKACPQMVKDREFIIKANKVWRKKWSEVATQYGLTPASLIKVITRNYNYHLGGYENNAHLCTVGAELPENLNVFALGEENKQQQINIPLLGYKPEYGNNNISARILIKSKSESLASSLFSYSYYWGNIENLEIVAQSSYAFPEEWFEQAPTEDIDYALKKWSQEQMSDFLKKCEKLVDAFGGDYGIS